MSYPQMLGWGGNQMAAIDCETSGLDPNYHEVIQIAIVPLDTEFEPLAEVKPFYTVVRPEWPERRCPKAAAAHKLDLDHLLMAAPEKGRVEDDLYEWLQRLGSETPSTQDRPSLYRSIQTKHLQNSTCPSTMNRMARGKGRASECCRNLC